MARYAYNDPCPVCNTSIKRRPVELTGRPCASCGEQWLTPRDRYRLRNARLTDAARKQIINDAKVRYNT